MRQTQRWMILLTAGVGLALPVAASAGSFQLNEQNAKSLARANAGDASANKDSSATYYNPALLTFIKKADFLVGANDYKIRGEFSKFSATDAAGLPLTGGNGGNFGDHNSLGAGVTPILSFAMPVANRTVFGVAIETPFGLTTTYDGTSVLRYQAQYTSIAVNNINPSIGYQVDKNFSIGFGIDYAQLQATLTNQVDYGAVCYAQLGPVFCNSAGLTPQSHDGFYKLQGSNWAYGWNLGMAWHQGGTTIGFAYRSRLFFDVSGTADFTDVPALFQASAAFKDTGAHAKANLPDTFDLSATQDIDSAWSVSATVRYVRWGVFNGLNIHYDNPNQPPTDLVFDYRNSWYLAAGADWRLNRSWTLHGGIAYDQSPIRNQYREPRLPGADRRWIALGATWTLAPSSSVSFGWAHLFMNDHIPMNNYDPYSGSTVVGQWSDNADLFSVQYQYHF